MRRRRRICVVTGTRAEYGLLRSLLCAVQGHPALELQLIATGTHLLRAFGATASRITRDGFRIDARVRCQDGSDDAAREAQGVGRAVAGMARAMQRLDADVVVVLGDRTEILAAAVAAACSRRVLAHIHGGDVAAGDIDDRLRHAVTKLADVHFPATRQSAARIERLGEDRARIHVVGSLALDELPGVPPPDGAWLDARLGVPDRRPYALVVQHPIGDSARLERRRMADTLAAVDAAGLWPVVVYPNSDPGHSGIVAAIEHRAKQRPGSVFRSLPRPDYLRALVGARVLVGNTSSAIIESATAGTAAVNIGPRQAGRQRCGPGVIDCPYGLNPVRRAIAAAGRKRVRRNHAGVYGDGKTGPRIAERLAALPPSESLRRKQIRY